MNYSELANWGTREGSSLFLHPPPSKEIKNFRYTHSVFGRRRKAAHIYKHPPPTQADLGHQKRENPYERTQGRFRTKNQTDPAEPGYVSNGICGIARYRPTQNQPNGNRSRKA